MRPLLVSISCLHISVLPLKRAADAAAAATRTTRRYNMCSFTTAYGSVFCESQENIRPPLESPIKQNAYSGLCEDIGVGGGGGDDGGLDPLYYCALCEMHVA